MAMGACPQPPMLLDPEYSLRKLCRIVVRGPLDHLGDFGISLAPVHPLGKTKIGLRAVRIKMATFDRLQTLTAPNTAIRILVIMILGFAGAFLLVHFLYTPSAEPQMAARYAAVAQERLHEHADELRQEAAALLAELAPPIVNAVQQQAQEDYVRYMRVLEREGNLYAANIEVLLKDKLRTHVRDYDPNDHNCRDSRDEK
jgi:hypothetical protein